MTEPVLEIEYEVSRAQLLRHGRRALVQWPTLWSRRIAAIACGAFAAYFAIDGSWLLALLVAIVALQYWSMLPLRVFVFVLAQMFAKGYRLHLTLDEKGILAQQIGKEPRTRYWWRGLRAVREDNEGIEVEFDSPGGIFVPQGSIQDAGLCKQFRRRVIAHAASVDPVAAGH